MRVSSRRFFLASAGATLAATSKLAAGEREFNQPSAAGAMATAAPDMSVQNQIDKLTAGGKPAHLLLGPGDYLTDGLRLRSSNFRLEGCGPATRIIGTDASNPIIRIVGAGPDKKLEHIAVANVTLVRSTPANHSLGIGIDYARFVLIENVHTVQVQTGIEMGGEHQGTEGITCQWIRVDNMDITLCRPADGSYGVRIRGGAADVRVDKLQVEPSGYGISMEDYSNGIFITDSGIISGDPFSYGIASSGVGFARHVLHCNIEGPATGQAIHANVPPPPRPPADPLNAYRLRVADCWIAGGLDTGVFFDQVRGGVTLVGNRIGQFGKRGIVVDNCDRVILDGNSLEGNVRLGAPESEMGHIEVRGSSRIILVNNIVDGINGKYHIWLGEGNSKVLTAQNLAERVSPTL
jgi:hypothetical protein